MKADMVSRDYVLGLDIGSASIGWAMIALSDSHAPASLIRAGVRIFEAGVEGNIQEGKDESKAIARRTARLQRRQLRRRAARQRELFRLLQYKQLLPPCRSAEGDFSQQRHELLNDLDKQLLQALRQTSGANSFASEQLLPYVLRKDALNRKLEPFELGRIFYHLNQRRGFLSNRRETSKGKDKEKELGKVKAGISDLEKEIQASGSRTLGEFFAGLDPHQQKVRRRWTHRPMFVHEFEEIWKKQHAYSPELLTDGLKHELARLLFYQRPIAKQDHLIGHCELEKDERHAPWAALDAQRFRLLQKVNDLKVIPAGSFEENDLTPEQREIVTSALQNEGDQTFVALRKLLRLLKTTFNLERGGEKKLPGNRTNSFMRSIFGERWDGMPMEEKNAIVELWRNEDSKDKLAREARELYGLNQATAEAFADKEAEDEYCNLSLKAIRKLLLRMELGTPFKTAEKEEYGDRMFAAEPKDLLPIVREVVPELRNPAVERALTELRKLINAIVREYGKPYEIRLEMARDLRKSRKEREETSQRNRQRQKEREKIKAKILREAGLQNPSRDQVELALLHDECGGVCPYTGRTIEFSSLFSGQSQFDVEHIIPLSICPDDSFLNKTLCYHEENRAVKGGRTPWQAYGADEERWNEIIRRVSSWKPGNPAKLRRFELKSTEELEGFSARQMNDTRYTTRLASKLLQALYGGLYKKREDGSNHQIIFATTGMATARLRKSWCLESILREGLPSSNGENKGKPRTDHRHHAIDAIVVALTSNTAIQWMAAAAAQAPEWQRGSRSFRSIQSPWPDFVDSIRPQIMEMLASHRPEHKMSGALHKDTYYGHPYKHQGKEVVNVRRLLAGLFAGQIEEIVDERVREAVQQKLVELGGEPKKFNPENLDTLPFLTAKDGRKILIKRVRVREAKTHDSLISLPAGHVQSESIHHFELFVSREGRTEKWKHVSVNLLDAFERKRMNQPIVSHSLPEDPEAEFLFSLMKKDQIELDTPKGRQIFRVKKFSANGQMWFVPVNNAQEDKDQKEDGTTWSKKPNELRKLSPRKVVVDLLGRVHPAND